MQPLDTSKPAASGTAQRAGGAYAFTRGLVRAGLALRGRRLRLIGGERIPASAAILRVCGKAGFQDALRLAAACERPLVVVLNSEIPSGADPLLAAGLGMILYHSEASAWHRALRACTEVLGAGGVLVVFEDAPASEAHDGAGSNGFTLAREAWSSAYPDRYPFVVPLHLFRPAARSGETLIYTGEALSPLAGDDAPVELSAPQLDAAFRSACTDNVFGLEETDLRRLLAALEDSLRERLQAAWASGPQNRQPVDGFELSPLASEAVRSMNRTDPGAVVELRQLAEADREAHRELALLQLRGEFERRQLSWSARVLGWIESVLGLPVAVYGALNHLVIAAVLTAGRLARRRAPPTLAVWVARALVVFGGYALQVTLVDRLLGRAAAGYYAATLPVSGAYLFRYGWLLQKRTRILLLGVRANRLRAAANLKRKAYYASLESALAAPPDAPPQAGPH